MKNLLIVAAFFTACTVGAQEVETVTSTGGLTTGAIVAGSAVAAVTVAVVASSDGTADPVEPPAPTLKCEGTDPLTDGVCIRTTQTTTVTSSGTGTATRTVTVPVTSTYAPTLG